MNKTQKFDDFHNQLAHDVLENPADENEILCVMLLFHSCQIYLTDQGFERTGVRGFAPITIRHVAEVASSLFSETPQNDPGYWYDKWNLE